MFLKHVQVVTELDRLDMIKDYQQVCPGTLPDNWWLNAVRWEKWNGGALDAAHGGDLTHLNLPEGISLRWTQAVQAKMQHTLARRCLMLEQHQGLASDTPGFIAKCEPLSKPGIFACLKDQGVDLEVSLSSRFSETPPEITQLFKFDTDRFGTGNALGNPWISVTPKGCRLRPCAVGLKHGYSAGNFMCKSFVFEGWPYAGSDWQELLRVTGQPLSTSGTVFEVPDAAPGVFFDSFRVRMLEPNSSKCWHLMVSWFDVFGHFVTARSWPKRKASP
ncbi:unnamed protein product [Effrenium voratum]|nr:unnamed protein product [Effrenium voratum]